MGRTDELEPSGVLRSEEYACRSVAGLVQDGTWVSACTRGENHSVNAFIWKAGPRSVCWWSKANLNRIETVHQLSLN